MLYITKTSVSASYRAHVNVTKCQANITTSHNLLL